MAEDETTPTLLADVSNDVSAMAAEHRSFDGGEFRRFPSEASSSSSSMFKTSAMKKPPTISMLTASPILNEYGGEGRLMQQVVEQKCQVLFYFVNVCQL